MKSPTTIFDNVRFPLIIGVIFIHCNFFMRASAIQVDAIWFSHDLYFSLRNIAEICVNTFFVMSGYLFFRDGEFSSESYVSKLKRRFFTLFIPYVIWTAIVALECLPFSDIINGRQVDYLAILKGFIAVPGTYFPVNPAMWYIRDLMVVVICSPIVYYALKYMKYMWVLILCALLSLRPETETILRSFMFFSLGAMFPLCRYDLVELLKSRVSIFIYVIFAIGTIAMFADSFVANFAFPFYLYWIYMVSGIFVVFSLGRYIQTPKALMNATFFVYASHWVFLGLMKKEIFVDHGFFPATELSAMLAVVGLLIVTLILSVAAYKFCSRFMPTLTGISCGGRVQK